MATGKDTQSAAKSPPAGKASAEPDKVDAKAEDTKVKADPKADADTKPAVKGKATTDGPLSRAGGYVDRGDGDGWVIEEDGE